MRGYEGPGYTLRRRHRQTTSWTVLGLVAAGLALRLYRLGDQSLWIDEILSLSDATLVYHQNTFLGGLMANLHGPLYTIFFYIAWQLAGLNEFWLRFPSVLAGTATLGAMYALASAVYDRHTAWWAVLLLALSPFHIWYSQEARNYSFVLLFATLSMYYFHAFLAGGRKRYWGHYVWTTAGALFSNLSSFFLLVVQGIIAMTGPASTRRYVPHLLVAGLVLVVALSPWLLEFNERLSPAEALREIPDSESELLRGETTFTPWGIPFTFFVFSLGYSAGPSLRELHAQSPLRAVGAELSVVVLAGLVFGVVAALGVWKTRDDRETLVRLLLYLTVPMIILSLLAARNIKVFNPRYLMVSLPAYYLLLARGLSQVGRAWLRWVNLGLVLLLLLYSLSNYYFDPRYAKEDIRSAVDYVETHADHSDVIVTTNCRSLFDLYYVGRPQVLDGRDLLGADGLATARNLDRVAARHQRLWLVQVRDWDLEGMGTMERRLESRFGLLDEQRFTGVQVSLFNLRSGEGEKL